jgi:DNA-binding NarL/FixJ family response regulator
MGEFFCYVLLITDRNTSPVQCEFKLEIPKLQVSRTMTIRVSPATGGDFVRTVSNMFKHSSFYNKILHIDDQPCMLQGLRAIVKSAKDLRIIASGAPVDVLVRYENEQPDIIVFEFPKGVEESARFIGKLRGISPTASLIALSSHNEAHIARYLFQLGINGYVLKRAAPQDVLYAIRKVILGGTYIDPAIASALVQPELAGSMPMNLSSREMNVMKLVARGFSNKEISGQLDLSVKTIETYRFRAAEKLGLRSRSAIVKFASSAGWLDGHLN